MFANDTKTLLKRTVLTALFAVPAHVTLVGWDYSLAVYPAAAFAAPEVCFYTYKACKFGGPNGEAVVVGTAAAATGRFYLRLPWSTSLVLGVAGAAAHVAAVKAAQYFWDTDNPLLN